MKLRTNKSCLKSFISLLLITVLFFSCNSEDAELKIPDNILNREQYAKVLLDMTLAESAANLNVKNLRIEKMDSAYAFDPLKENNITKTQYDSSVAFYSRHPEVYKEVYDNVLERLSEMEAQRVAKDSLKK